MVRKKKQVEIELKLRLPSAEAEKEITAKIREGGYSLKELESLTNTDIYLDTFDWLLFKKQLTLRYRMTNGKAVYTVKSLGEIADGIARRRETEIKVSAPVAIPADCPVPEIKEIITPLIYPRRLLEQILIRTQRRRYRVISPEGAVFELCFDSAGFSLRGMHKPKRVPRLQEMEAEMIRGDVQALEAFAALLQKEFNYPPSPSSKLETAMEKLKVKIPSKKPPENLKVLPADRMDLALRKIIAGQLNWFCENLPGVKLDVDTEFVHQARVATRRMRSALLLFREAIPPALCDYLRNELQWLGEILGAVRDLDVFLLNLPQFKMNINRFPKKRKIIIAEWIEMHRRAPLKDLIQTLESSRYANLERRLRAFIESPAPQRPCAPLALKTVEEAAPAIIRKHLDAVIAQGLTVIGHPQLKEFHRLRINMKRLRYACEFVASAYGGDLDLFIEQTVDIQDCLGEIQDTVFTRDFIDYLFANWSSKLVDPEIIFILGEIYQLQTTIERQRRESFGKIWEKFSAEEHVKQMLEILFTKK